MSKLALHGGKKIRTRAFPAQETIGKEEIIAVSDILHNKKLLSDYRGSWNDQFWGGEEVQTLEKEWAKYFETKYAIACNSCTSALIIACGAIGAQPRDEYIVTPWSMSCSATAPMWWGGVPIFADIEKDYFCLDSKSIEKQINKRTRAIIVVDLFGQPYDIEEINRIADRHGLFIIEDAAQAIGSKYKNRYAGTFGDIGCFSLTTGKHLTAGEGGLIVTNDEELAFNCRLIMNHAEAVINDMGKDCICSSWENIIGFNMRMTEIQAAIAREQLKKLNRFVTKRQQRVEYLNNKLKGIPFITPAETRESCTHSYYVHAFKYNNTKIHRNKFIDAVKAELTGEEGRPNRPLLGNGYITPIYLFPVFKNKMHWTLKQEGWERYYRGLCPATEKLWEDDLFLSMYHNLPLSENDMDDIIKAFYKVYENMEELL